MSPILTVTLNPAIDITTAVDRLVPELKLRCDAPTVQPGGGGVNVSRVIKELGGVSTALVAIGGVTGELMRALLSDAGLETVFVESCGATRQSFAVHDRSHDEQYRFVLPGPVEDDAFAQRALEAIDGLLAKAGCRYVVGSGSLPPGVADDFYARIARVVAGRRARFILDTSGPALAAALGGGVFLVKPNHIEARTLADMFGAPTDEPERLAARVVAAGAAEAVILTLGADGAVLATSDGVRRMRAPPVEVVSKVGAGDSFIGALSHALASDWSLDEAFAFGVAAAAAAVTTTATKLARRDDVERLYARIEDLS